MKSDRSAARQYSIAALGSAYTSSALSKPSICTNAGLTEIRRPSGVLR